MSGESREPRLGLARTEGRYRLAGPLLSLPDDRIDARGFDCPHRQFKSWSRAYRLQLTPIADQDHLGPGVSGFRQEAVHFAGG